MTSLRQNRMVRQVAYWLTEPLSRGRLKIDKEKLHECKRTNRKFLNSIASWIHDEDYNKSIFQYGLPAHLRHLIDMPMTEETTYSDVISCAANGRGAQLKYLELGVSVGKNVSQIISQAQNAEITCFDIENTNPVLREMLTYVSEDTWPTSTSSARKEVSRLTEYRSDKNGNMIYYLAGDIFDEQAWARLRGRKFNVIFSDAFHSADAMRREWEMIKSFELLPSKDFTLFWDDLGNRDMRKVFYDIAREVKTWPNGKNANVGIEFLRGWLGRHEPHHPIGFINYF